MVHQSLQHWGVWLKCCLCSSRVSDLSLSPFQSAGESAALLSSEALTTLVFVLCWFQLCHYVILKATWRVTGELCGCIGFFWVPDNSRYLTTAMIIHRVAAFWEAGLCSYSLLQVRRKKSWWCGLNLVSLHPPIHDPLPSPHAGRRQVVGLWEGWLQACPSGSGCHSSSSTPFLSAGSEVGGGNAWEAGVICAKQGPKLEQG